MKKTTLLLMLLMTMAFAYAQDNPWINYTNTTRANAVAREGNLVWIGTSGGLVKYDTITEEKTFYNATNSGLPGNYIGYIHIDALGNKWMSVGHNQDWVGDSDAYYLTKFDGITWTTYNPPHSGSSNPENINCIDSDSMGNIWVGSFGGVKKFDGINWTVYNNQATGMNSSTIYALTIDNEDNVWIGTAGDGIGKFNGTYWDIFNTPDNDLDGTYALLADANGLLWVSSMNSTSGFATFDGVNWNLNPGLQLSSYLTTMVVGNNSTIWVSDGFHVSHFNGTNWTTYPTNDVVYSICAGEGDSLWLGTEVGLQSQANGQFSQMDIANNTLPSNMVHAIHSGNSGNVMIGTIGGLCCYNGTSWTEYDIMDGGYDNDVVTSITTDNTNNLWFSYYSNIIGKYDGTNYIYYDLTTVLPGLGTTIISDMSFDQQNNLWISTSSGVIKHDGQAWSLYNHSNSGFPGWLTTGLCVDLTGNVWVVAPGFGIVKYNGTDWTVYSSANTVMPYNEIRAIYCDAGGNIWFATYLNNMPDCPDAALVKFDGENWNVLHEEIGGLPIDRINAITQDNTGIMWFATTDGLIKFENGIWTLFQFANPTATMRDMITSMACDAQGNVWIGTEHSGLLTLDGTYVSNDEHVLTIDNQIKMAPNPIRDNTTISIDLNKSGKTEINIFNLKGQKVTTLVNTTLSKGKHEYNWNLIDDNGNKVSSGVYFIRMTNAGKSSTQKVVVLK